MKKKLIFSAAFMAILLWGATTGNIQWTQIRSTDRHGTDAKGQSSDGTGSSGNFAKYDVNGGVTNGAPGPDGTSTHYLDGSGAWSTPAGGGGGSGGRVLLFETTAAAVAAITVTTRNVTGQSGAIFQTDFDDYEIRLIDYIPATTNTGLWLQYSTNGGSSYDSTSGHYGWGAFNQVNAGTGGNGSGSDTKISLSGAVANDAGFSANGRYRISDPLSASLNKLLMGETICFDTLAGTRQAGYFDSGFYLQTAAVNAFQILSSSGNVTSAILRVYGFSK